MCKILIPNEVKSILKILENNNFEAYLVGGFVRDYILNIQSSDFDITTNANPKQIQDIFKDYIIVDIGKKLGTQIIKINNIEVEITPYRIEHNYSIKRKPQDIIFSNNLIDDLQRRDFTINSICMNYQMKIIDHFNGVNDIKNKIIKTIDDPNIRFKEDPLRILRAIRFKNKLDFKIENKTLDSIFRNKDLLKNISMERKMDEFLKILDFNNSYNCLNEFEDVFKTFLDFKNDIRVDNFNDNLYKLAIIVCNFNDLKLSKKNINLLTHLHNAFKIDIENDTELIDILSDTNYFDTTLCFLNTLHNRNINIKKIKNYICDKTSIDINTQDFINLNIDCTNISKIIQQLLNDIHNKKIVNENKSLINHLKQNYL